MFYLSLNDYIQKKFGRKLYKIALSGGYTCPNRDGTAGWGGCIFCSGAGSGEFASPADIPVSLQLSMAKKRIQSKLPKEGGGYIAYFQSFTGTYGPPSYFAPLWQEAVDDEDVYVLDIGTRPDYLPEEILELLGKMRKQKPVWVELGLQTIHEKTARYIRRGYDLSCFQEGIKALKERDIEVIVHVILGLPGESKEQMLETVDYVGRCGADGIKLHLLNVLKGTDLEQEYDKGQIAVMEMEEYFALLGQCLSILPETMVIHRLTGDGPKSILRAPLWVGDKKRVLNGFYQYGKAHHIRQGSAYGKELL